MQLRTWAEDIARAHLAETLPRRWAHVLSVAAEAERISCALGDDGDLLVAVAVLHDVGYAPGLVTMGFHPLDGARFLLAEQAPARFCALVARHSNAVHEAELRGCADELQRFPDEKTPLRDALWYCDMVTGPNGQRLNVHDRIAEIQSRYGPDSIVGRFIVAANPELVAAVERTITLYTAAGIPQPKYG